MGTSGNPAVKAAQKKASSAAEFKKRLKGMPLPLPTGLVVMARRVELTSFIRQGTVPNPLMEVVQEALNKGKKADVSKMVGVDDGSIDLQMINDMYDMVNKIVISSVVEPKVHPTPTEEDVEAYRRDHPEGPPVNDPEELKDDDLLYVDEFDDEDKMFIYQWATGGTSDIEQFRSEAAADLASLAEGQGGKQSPKRVSRAKS